MDEHRQERSDEFESDSRIRTEVKNQATRVAQRQVLRTGKSWLLRFGLLKASAVIASLAVVALVFLSLFGATYLAALTCTSTDQALLGPGGGVTVGGSEFGDPVTDPKTGHKGYRSDDLREKWDSYAELSSNPTAADADLDWSAIGKAMGRKELPYETALRVTSDHGSIILYKRDRGRGGGEVQGVPRAIDIWYMAARKLKVKGLFLLKVEPVSGATAAAAPDVSFTGGYQASDKMARPTSGPITSPFGPRWGRLHAGVDIAPPAGTPIVAALSGKILNAGPMGGYGNFICIRHAARLSTCYGHQQRFATGIRTGVNVQKGQRIGYVGNTGNSTGPHLHFEVRLGVGIAGRPTDPMPYLKGSTFAEELAEVPVADRGDQCVTGNAVNVSVNGNYAWPIGNSRVGKNIIGRPGHGTHSHTEPPNNWQSDNAIDIGTRRGDPVVAVDSGTISPTLGFGPLTSDSSSRFAGIRLYLVDSGGNQWYYSHLSKAAVKPGDRVSRGDVIGYSGSANGVEHLHLAVKSGNPLTMLGAQ